MSPEARQRQGQEQAGGSGATVHGMWPSADHGEVHKGPSPSTQSQVSQGQAWSGGSRQVAISGYYSPGDHGFGLPLHTDAHGNILAFSY